MIKFLITAALCWCSCSSCSCCSRLWRGSPVKSCAPCSRISSRERRVRHDRSFQILAALSAISLVSWLLFVLQVFRRLLNLFRRDSPAPLENVNPPAARDQGLLLFLLLAHFISLTTTVTSMAKIATPMIVNSGSNCAPVAANRRYLSPIIISLPLFNFINVLMRCQYETIFAWFYLLFYNGTFYGFRCFGSLYARVS